jgi:hypothetical protein
MRPPRSWLLSPFLLAGCGGDYWLGGGPGGEALSSDVVLTGADSFERDGADGGTCLIAGNGHGIRTIVPWTGQLVIRHCTISGLGSALLPAIALDMSDGASATIEDSTFDASGAVEITDSGTAPTVFRNNAVLESSVVALDADSGKTTPAFTALGTSTAPKLFQGNRIDRSSCTFASPNWLVGGDTDAESNLIVGLRAGIVVRSSGVVVRGNYVHNIRYPGAGDESALAIGYDTHDAIVEHNVLRHGDWVVRTAGGELRYNAILDADPIAWIVQPLDGAKIHHNVMMMCAPRDPASPDLQAGIQLVNVRASGIEIHHNTLDGGGVVMRASGSAVSVESGSFLDSLRSNAFVQFPFERNDATAAAVRAGIAEPTVPPPARLGYADYNLFYNPDQRAAHNYALSVAGRAQRTDAGFARSDVHAGGPIDEQVAPGFVPTSGSCFPWSDADIRARAVTVSTMLAAYRAAYTPTASSPLLGAGDPADGAGTFIGAVGDGTLAEDKLGTFGR